MIRDFISNAIETICEVAFIAALSIGFSYLLAFLLWG